VIHELKTKNFTTKLSRESRLNCSLDLINVARVASATISETPRRIEVVSKSAILKLAAFRINSALVEIFAVSSELLARRKMSVLLGTSQRASRILKAPDCQSNFSFDFCDF